LHLEIENHLKPVVFQKFLFSEIKNFVGLLFSFCPLSFQVVSANSLNESIKKKKKKRRGNKQQTEASENGIENNTNQQVLMLYCNH